MRDNPITRGDFRHDEDGQSLPRLGNVCHDFLALPTCRTTLQSTSIVPDNVFEVHINSRISHGMICLDHRCKSKEADIEWYMMKLHASNMLRNIPLPFPFVHQT